MLNKELDLYSLPNDTPVAALECKESFHGLTNKEKLYAHYISRASWYGTFINSVQRSRESPLIMLMLLKLFQNENYNTLKKLALEKCGFTEEEFQCFCVYVCGVLEYHGNYKTFGESKIIPRVSKQKVQSLLMASVAWKSDNMEFLWNSCSDAMFSLNEREKQFGFSPTGITTFFSSNCTETDGKIVDRFLLKENIDPYNTRAFKTSKDGKTCYEIRFASVEESVEEPKEFEGCEFYKTKGDYGDVLRLLCDNLRKAQDHVANKLESDMLQHYITSFQKGSLDAHKDGSRAWVKNKNPAIETYIGFIETYTDPSGVRGEFEGFVAVVNRNRSRVYAELVSKAEDFLPKLPWPSTHEKDKFLRPDFTALDVVTFAGSMPIGINIPNYDNIRQNEGFKNVTLSNVIQTRLSSKTVNFVSKEDEALIIKYRAVVYELKVGLHELLGHGSGKLLKRNKDGSFNFDKDSVIDPITKEKISCWYEAEETYDHKFGYIGSAYEECRAECVALHLCLEDDVMKVFTNDECFEEHRYINFLSMALSGFGVALEKYRPETKSWLQAHCHARFVILRVLLEHGDGIVTIKEVEGSDGKPDLRLSLDRSKIKTSGKNAIANFLLKLQAYRSTGNITEAKRMFEHYGSVSDEGSYPFLKWREIALARRKPRELIVKPNTFLTGDTVELKEYSADPEGMINSWLDRYKDDKLDDIVIEMWKKDSKHFAH